MRCGMNEARHRGVGVRSLLPSVVSVLLTGGIARAAVPAISVQPSEQVLQIGEHGGFEVVAANATSYQWYVSAGSGAPTPIAGATGAFLLTPPVTAAQNGSMYAVSVTNPSGTVMSAAAPLYISPNADGSPPDYAWGNIAALPAPRQVLMTSFVNGTLGRIPSGQMFWSIQYTNGAGQTVSETHSFADQPTFDMPQVGGTRIYFYIAPNAASIGTGPANYYDFLEINVGRNANGPYWINMDTTRVDRWGLPIVFRLQCGDGTLAKRGDDVGTFVDPRDIVFLKYMAELGTPWSIAASTTSPYGINEPGAAGFGQNGPYASYYTAYVNQVWAADRLSIPKPTNFLDLQTQLPDLSAALERHVAVSPGSFNPDGTLADASFWSKNPPSTFYAAAPSNFYSAFWHEHAVSHLQYGFPYDDDDGQSSDVGCQSPQTLVIGVGY